jgi:hypothetical protein
MTPQKRWVVLIDLITTKVIKFQNFVKSGADGYVLLEVCCRDWDQSGKLQMFSKGLIAIHW